MTLRTSKALKFFSILLFFFGLAAPAVVNASTEDNVLPEEQQLVLTGPHHSNLFLQLLFEEISSEEERETKAHKPIFFLTDFSFAGTLVEVRGPLTYTFVRFKSQDRFDSQPARFKRFRSFLI